MIIQYPDPNEIKTQAIKSINEDLKGDK